MWVLWVEFGKITVKNKPQGWKCKIGTSKRGAWGRGGNVYFSVTSIHPTSPPGPDHNMAEIKRAFTVVGGGERGRKAGPGCVLAGLGRGHTF